MNTNKFVSLNELAKKLKLNKSTLTYYASLGVITPITVVGRMQLFNKNDVLKQLAKVKEEQKKGKTLKQIGKE